MGVIQKITNWLASFRAVGGIDLPDTGRSSDETFGGRRNAVLSNYSTVSPIIDFQSLEILEKFAVLNPDVSQSCDNIKNLANTGHTILIDAKSETVAENTLARINETAARLYRNGAGVDGLINAYLFQIAVFGALSSEDVVNFAGRRVEQTVLVPVKSIRFKYDNELGVYQPYQKSNNWTKQNKSREALGLIPLHPETYRYYALQTIENSPYGIPPASAAIEAIISSQKPIMENIAYIAQKVGLLGMFSASVTPPPKKPGETDAEHQSRAKQYLENVSKVLTSRLRDGLLVAYRDQKIEHTNITEGASGVYDINRMSEEQIMSGLGMQPAFFGRTDSTTETFADVVYSLLMAKTHNVQRLVKRRQEQTYRLDTRLGGLEVDGISMRFNKSYSRNISEENQAEKVKFETVLAKVKSGLLSPTEGAQELGLESWFDEELIGDNTSITQLFAKMQNKKSESFSFSFDQHAQKYKFVRPQITLLSETEETSMGNVIPIKKKALSALN